MSRVSAEKVKEMAYLARLEMNSSDVEKYQEELSKILDYIKTINKVNTKNVQPTSQVTGLSDVWASDAKNPSKITREEILSNAPEKKDGYIKVKPVLE